MINESSSSTIKKRLRSKTLLLGSVILLILFSANFIRNWQNNQKIDQEINNLELEINQRETDNARLAELIKYLNSTAYIEEKARTDLGLRKEGEEAVVIPDIEITPATTNDSLQLMAESKTVSIPQKWWQYFFAKK